MAESEAALAQRLLREQADYLGVSLIEAASDRLDVLDRSPATKITSAVRVSVIEQVRLRSEVWLAFIERHYPAAGPVPSGEALTVMVEAATVRLPVQSRADATWLATRLLRP